MNTVEYVNIAISVLIWSQSEVDTTLGLVVPSVKEKMSLFI